MSSIKNIIFIGDSILNNQLYVPKGKNVQNFLEKKLSFKIFNYAKDGATITSIYQQINQIPSYLNNKETILFLSVGGNDILSFYINNPEKEKEDIFIYKLFFNFQSILQEIVRKMNLSKIYILDLYYPIHPYFKTILPVLKKWNQLLKNNNENIPVIQISNILTQSKDFIEFIEPSELGGEKIADFIYQTIA